jgi:uncharacterized protein YecE (DUF72 family)
MARTWIGTSGWSYTNWRGPFYPPGTKPREWLAFYAQHLRSVEINTTFYRLPAAAMLAGWHARTPAGFLFAIKAWRAITHFKRLHACEAALASFFGAIAPLAEKAGPVLFQLPPRFARDTARLSDFLALLPRGRRFAFEFRDPSWHDDAVYHVLAAHNVAFCPFELAALVAPRVVTADFIYVRLHGRKARYRGAYPQAALADWAAWLGTNIAAGRDAYVFFDNTDQADHAVRDALRLERLLGDGTGRP